MRKESINRIIIICLSLTIISCHKNIDKKVDIRVKKWISIFEQDIEIFSNKYDLFDEILNDESINIFNYNEKVTSKIGYINNFITTKEQAIVYGKAIFNINIDIGKTSQLYAIPYKNVWIVYGCKNLRKFASNNWKDLGEWDEYVTVFSKHDGKILLVNGGIK